MVIYPNQINVAKFNVGSRISVCRVDVRQDGLYVVSRMNDCGAAKVAMSEPRWKRIRVDGCVRDAFVCNEIGIERRTGEAAEIG
jgi:hypothetical protein